MQSPSFLAHQRDMHQRKGRDNVGTLFGAENIPTDVQIRNSSETTIRLGQLVTQVWLLCVSNIESVAL
jgi:hypothetical protein